MVKYKVIISYWGLRYFGFQFQPDVSTIEQVVKEALYRIYQESVSIIGAGRTDSGVHALQQVFHFRVRQQIPAERLKKALNRYLPEDVRVLDVQEVEFGFNARRSAVAREYHYLFTDGDIPFYLNSVITKIKFEPQLDVIDRIKECVLGEHDFACFRKLGSFERSTVRTITDFDILRFEYSDIYQASKQYYFYRVRIVANSFLYSMVRNLVGSIFEVLKGRVDVQLMCEMVDRQIRYPYTLAPARGLCLVQVFYESK